MADQENTQTPEQPREEHTSAAAQTGAAGGLEREGPSLATAALVGVGVALLEPELIPGVLIGAGAVMAPKLLPAIGGMLRPLVKGVVKMGYQTTMRVRESVAEAGEQFEDIVAEARAEGHGHEHAGNGHQPAQPEQQEHHQ